MVEILVNMTDNLFPNKQELLKLQKASIDKNKGDFCNFTVDRIKRYMINGHNSCYVPLPANISVNEVERIFESFKKEMQESGWFLIYEAGGPRGIILGYDLRWLTKEEYDLYQRSFSKKILDWIKSFWQ
jgi:hypothetical protein